MAGVFPGEGHHPALGLHLGPEADAIGEAARDFKASLNKGDAEDFEECTMQLVCCELNSIQHQQQEKKTLMNLMRVQRFLMAMGALEAILEELGLPEVKTVMSCIWGPMRFLFKTTYVNEKAFDNVLEVYQRLGLHLLPLSEYKRLFIDSPYSRLCLAHIYKDVVGFHATVYKLFSLRSSLWVELHMSAWRDLEFSFDHLASAMELHSEFITAHATRLPNWHSERIDSGFEDNVGVGFYPAYDNSIIDHKPDQEFQRYQRRYHDAQSMFTQSEVLRRRSQKERILKWIAASNQTEMLHVGLQRTRKLCSPENGRWLWRQHDEVDNWMHEDPPADSAVWIHGRKGMGKTVLSSLVVDHLHELAGDGRIAEVPQKTQVCYFYCQEADSELDTHLGILRGILHQLVDAVVVESGPEDEDCKEQVAAHSDAADNDDDENSARNNRLNSGSNINIDVSAAILSLCDDQITKSGGSTLENVEVAQQLIDVFFDNSTRQYVIIDGLDECRLAADISHTVSFLTKQVTKCEGHSQGQLRVLFVSQSTPDVRKAMAKSGIGSGAGEVQLGSKGNAANIMRYVRMRLDSTVDNESRRPTFQSSEMEKLEIEDRIWSQSEGSFLYAHLATEYLLSHLGKGNIEQVKLGMLPDGIPNMYNELLGTIKARLLEESALHWEKARLLLGWLVFAYRPLKRHEIQAILSFDPDTETFDLNLRTVYKHITNVLGSLVQVLPGDNIRLIHSSATEHLVRTNHINAESVKCDLAIICLRYLSLRCFAADNYREDERRDHVARGYFSFQDYAVAHWHQHIISVVKDCRLIFPPCSQENSSQTNTFINGNRPDYTGSFSYALAKFIRAYDADLKPLSSHEGTEDTLGLRRQHIDRFAALPFYHDLLRLWNHIDAHQSSSLEDRNKVGLARLETALESHRALIENSFSSPRASDCKTVGEESMDDYYGPRPFKCRHVLCKFFHHGFDNKKDREGHHNRHDRPYPCPVEQCSYAPIGFSSNKDKERHVRNYHPDMCDGPSAFLQMSRRVETAKFRCTICQKSFTRNINLKGHERSHFGERPYACSKCGKAFARLNDCRRHEKIHVRKAA